MQARYRARAETLFTVLLVQQTLFAVQHEVVRLK